MQLLNSKGKSVKIGVKNLIQNLKASVCPTQCAESANMTKNEQLIFKSFTPNYLTAIHWKEIFNHIVEAETNLEH